MGILGSAKSLEELELEKQRVASEEEIAQRRAAIAQYKKRYGGGGIVDKVTTFLGKTKSGLDWSAVKFRVK